MIALEGEETQTEEYTMEKIYPVEVGLEDVEPSDTSELLPGPGERVAHMPTAGKSLTASASVDSDK